MNETYLYTLFLEEKMKYVTSFILILMVLISCSMPGDEPSSSSTSNPVTTSDIIASLSIDPISPINPNATRSITNRAALTSGTVGYMEWEYTNNNIQPPNVPETIIEVFKKYTESADITFGQTIELPLLEDIVTNSQPPVVDIGSSKIQINKTADRISIYWNTTVDMGGGPTPLYIQVYLENFTEGIYTDYDDIFIWLEIENISKIFAFNDYVTGTFERYSPPLTTSFSGEVTLVGRADNGVFLKQIRTTDPNDPNMTVKNGAFGDGNRLAICSYSGISARDDRTEYVPGETRYYVDDENVFTDGLTPADSRTFTGTNRDFLDTGLTNNIPSADWGTITGPGTEWNRLYGSSGVFDDELVTDTFFN
jgi:hypothetical protein